MKIPVWVVTNVQPQKDYTLILTFVSGEKSFLMLAHFLQKQSTNHWTTSFFFWQPRLIVTWSDEMDIAPEYLYEYSLPLQVI